jgi:hypothetical protein
MQEPKKPVDRRTMLAGAGAVGALATTAVMLPGADKTVAAQPADTKPAPDTAGGYRLTEHIKRYYATARI